MRTHASTASLALGLVTLLVPCAISTARNARACATAPHPGQVVGIADEEALILWNAATHTEQFIRRATFRAPEGDFGFLVPTPTQPALGEAPNALFSTLDRIVAPVERDEHTHDGILPTLSCMMFLSRAAPGAGAPMQDASVVRVLDARRVAGFDAVVLEADSPTALAEWLRAHGYEARATLTAWLAPYVAAHWKITAFRIAPRDADAGVGVEGELSTTAVRMTFTTDRPFYPYREPADPHTGPVEPRRLRVFVASDARMEGTLGEHGTWPGRVTYAQAIQALPQQLGLTEFNGPSQPWLTAFEDASSPRLGTDEVYFRPAADRAPVIPPPIVYRTNTPTEIPLDWIAIPGVVGWWIVRRVRRRRAGAAPTG